MTLKRSLSLCALLLFPAGTATLADPPVKPTRPPSSGSRASEKPVLDAVLLAAMKAAPSAVQLPNSDYMRLLDLGEVHIRPDGTMVAEMRETYKLFNQRARSLAEVSLPYNASYQEIKVLKAHTIKKDGTVVEVRPEDIRVTSPYSEYLMYDDVVAVGFSMPAIEEECIVDYTFRLTTRPLLMPGQFWTYWGFTDVEPVALSRYTVHVPADRPLQFRISNDSTLKPTVTPSADGRTKTYIWERRDLKPMPREPAMPSFSELRTSMEISSLHSWQDISRWFWEMAKPQMQPTQAIRDTVARVLKDKTSEEAKARALYDWVANRTRYVGLEFGLSAFRPHPAGEVHDKLYGDCKDKATLLVTMLRLAGLKAHPVLLKASDRRPVEPNLPNPAAFNHCIALAEIEGKEVWLDATSETCAYGDIPDSDRGAQALVVREGVGRFQTIPDYLPEENGVMAKMQVTLHSDGSATTQTEIAMRGASGQELRGTVRAITPDRRREMMQRLAQSFAGGGSLKEYSLPDGNKKEGAFALKLTVEATGYAETAGSLLLVPLSPGTNGTSRQNPFVNEQRVWPIVAGSSALSRSETIITLPPGYVIADLPLDTRLSCPLQEYERVVTRSADGKTITVIETIRERIGTAPPSEYAAIKTYYEKALKLAKSKIVLKEAGK